MRAIVSDDETIVDNKAKVLKTFDGPKATAEASAFIGTLPAHERGRYSLDACIQHENAHCDGCDCFSEMAEQIVQGFNDEIEGYLYMRFGD